MYGGACFDEAAGEHAVEVLEEAISAYGKPESIPSDRGTRFCAAESKKRPKWYSTFEKRLNDLGILHVPAQGGPTPDQRQAGAGAPGEVRRKLRLFHDVAGRPGVCSVNPPHIETDPVARFVRWHNSERPHMSLDADVGETPEMAFERKTPLPGSDVTDE